MLPEIGRGRVPPTISPFRGSPAGGGAVGGMAAHGLVKAAEKDIGIESP